MNRMVDVDEFLHNLTHWVDEYGWSHNKNQDSFSLEDIKDAIEGALQKKDGRDQKRI